MYLEKLFGGRPIAGVELGLERIDDLLDALGRPDANLDVFHLAGTNGKGSTAAFLESVLRHGGARTGLYTSPHVRSIRERFLVCGEEAPGELMEATAARLLSVPESEPCTWFEIATAFAFALFEAAGADTAVMETGLGGRLDATNAVRDPLGVAITTIGLDHMAMLGDTIAEIAAEKAGIIKPGRPVCIGRMDGSAEAVIRTTAAARGAPVRVLGSGAEVTDCRVTPEGTHFVYRSGISGAAGELSAVSGMNGRHQADNAAVALMLLEAAEWFPDEAAVVRGIAEARLPARFDSFSALGHRWIVDLAHNPQAFRSFLRTMGEAGVPRPWTFIVGFLGDKSWAEMLELVAEVADGIILTPLCSAPFSRQWDADAALAVLNRRRRSGSGRGPTGTVAGSMGEAIYLALRSREGVTAIAGSAHAAGEAFEVLDSPGPSDTQETNIGMRRSDDEIRS